MGRIMAIDVGEATLGVALSDALRLTAQPVTTLRRRGLRRDLEALADLVRENEVESLVVGLPLRLAGDSGPAAQSARAFARRLQDALELPVHTWDERLTTAQAERVLLEGDVRRSRRRAVINHVAAAIILQSYLDSLGAAES